MWSGSPAFAPQVAKSFTPRRISPSNQVKVAVGWPPDEFVVLGPFDRPKIQWTIMDASLRGFHCDSFGRSWSPPGVFSATPRHHSCSLAASSVVDLYGGGAGSDREGAWMPKAIAMLGVLSALGAALRPLDAGTAA